LTALEDPTVSQAEAVELLTRLVENYERERFPIPSPDPVAVVRFLIEQQHLVL
jgi:HTH-type transcriptional regulator / antitoxin HigA